MSEMSNERKKFPYEAWDWNTGDVITQEKLDFIEQGIKIVSEQIWNALPDNSDTMKNTNQELYNYFQTIQGKFGTKDTTLNNITESGLKTEILRLGKIAEEYQNLFGDKTVTLWNEYPVLKNTSLGQCKFNVRNSNGELLTDGYNITKFIPEPEGLKNLRFGTRIQHNNTNSGTKKNIKIIPLPEHPKDDSSYNIKFNQGNLNVCVSASQYLPAMTKQQNITEAEYKLDSQQPIVIYVKEAKSDYDKDGNISESTDSENKQTYIQLYNQTEVMTGKTPYTADKNFYMVPSSGDRYAAKSTWQIPKEYKYLWVWINEDASSDSNQLPITSLTIDDDEYYHTSQPTSISPSDYVDQKLEASWEEFKKDAMFTNIKEVAETIAKLNTTYATISDLFELQAAENLWDDMKTAQVTLSPITNENNDRIGTKLMASASKIVRCYTVDSTTSATYKMSISTGNSNFAFIGLSDTLYQDVFNKGDNNVLTLTDKNTIYHKNDTSVGTSDCYCATSFNSNAKPDRLSVSSNSTRQFTIPSNITHLLFWTSQNGTDDHTPTEIRINIDGKTTIISKPINTDGTSISLSDRMTQIIRKASNEVKQSSVRLTDTMCLLDLLPRHYGYYDLECGQLKDSSVAKYIQIPVHPNDRIFITGNNTSGRSFIYAWLNNNKEPINANTIKQPTDGDNYIVQQKVAEITYKWCHPGFTAKAPQKAEFLYILITDASNANTDLTPSFVQINDVILTAIPVYKSYTNDPSTRLLPLAAHLIMPPRSGDVYYTNKPVQYGSSSNNQRLSTPPLCFDQDVYLTASNPDYLVRIHYVTQESLLDDKTLQNGYNYSNLLIHAHQLFYLVIYNDESRQDTAQPLGDENPGRILTLEQYGIKLTYQPIAKKTRWIALGDSITEKYYSITPPTEETNIATMVHNAGQLFYRKINNESILYQAKIDIKVKEKFNDIATDDTVTNCERYNKIIHGRSQTDPTRVWTHQVANTLGWELTNKAHGGAGFLHYGGGATIGQEGYRVARDTNFANYDVVTVSLGINDWKGDRELGTINSVCGEKTGQPKADNETYTLTDNNKNYDIQKQKGTYQWTEAPTTIYGAIKATVEAIMATNPFCRIIFTTPLNALGYFNNTTTNFQYAGSPNYGITYKYDNSKKLEDVYQAIVDVCQLYGIPYIDLTHKSPINKLNIYSCLPDGIHPSLEAHKMIAEHLAGALKSNFETITAVSADNVDNLKSALENASTQPIHAIYLNDLELLQGYINSANNYISDNLNFCRTNMLDVSDTESIVVNLVGSTTNVTTIACYDSNMNFLSSKSKKETFSGTFTIPEGVKYIIISTNISRKNYPCDIICRSVNINDAFSTRTAQLTRFKNDIVTINEQIVTVKKIDDLTLHSGFISASGLANQHSNYSYTNLLDVSETTDINVNLIGFNTNIAVIACYDENGHFSASDSIIQASYNGTFTIPDGIKYIRLTTSNATIGNECSIVCKSTLLEDAFLTREKNNEVVIKAAQITNDVSTKKDMYYEVPASDRTVHSGAYLKGDGTEKDEQDGRWRYETIPVSVGEKFLVTSHAGMSALLWIVLNSNGGVVDKSNDTSGFSKKTETVTIPPNGVTLVVNEQMNASWYLLDVSIKRIVNINLIDQDKVEIGKETLIDYIKNNNPLYGKILCCCGDSITYGGELEDTGDAGFTNSDVINVYNWSGTGASGSWVKTTTGIRMTYGWHIARRNHMTFYNGGVNGSTIQGISDKNGFSLANGRYTQLPNNIDYLTIFFGWNDKTYGTLGEITDTTNESYYGAYNVVMPYLINKYPYTKICLIVPFGTDEGHRNAIRLLADKWGVACFDMMQSGTPLYWGKESNVNVDADIITENRTKFQCTPTSAHPNRYGHKQIADMLESFLRMI